MVKFSIDGVDIASMGVHVSRSTGIIGMPEIKERRMVSYADESGAYVDLSAKPRFEMRYITLDCVMVGGRNYLQEKFRLFMDHINRPGTRRLLVDTGKDTSKPLVFEVYTDDSVDVVPEWGESESVLEFSLRLVEQKPIKRVYRILKNDDDNREVSLSIDTRTPIDVHWGDGKHDLAVYGEVALNHLYTGHSADNALLVLSGDIDKLVSSDIDVDSVLVWAEI